MQFALDVNIALRLGRAYFRTPRKKRDNSAAFWHWHSQMTMGFQPRALRADLFRRSRLLLLAIFEIQ